jgi:hypothetical protein
MVGDWRGRLRAAGLHFVASLVVGSLAALLVFALWYPYPYSEISGGRELFLLVVSVDVVLGPLITLMVFNRAKPLRELQRDLFVVVLLQLAGLAYGLWTVAIARPVHLVFEYDRLRVVHAVDVPEELLPRTPAGIEALPLAGPTLLAVRPFRDDQEKTQVTMEALQGIQIAARPDFWRPYAAARADVLKAATPVDKLKQRFPQHAAQVDQVLQKSGRAPAAAVSLPIVARKATAWTVLLDANTAEVLGFVPVDSF